MGESRFSKLQKATSPTAINKQTKTTTRKKKKRKSFEKKWKLGYLKFKRGRSSSKVI